LHAAGFADFQMEWAWHSSTKYLFLGTSNKYELMSPWYYLDSNVPPVTVVVGLLPAPLLVGLRGKDRVEIEVVIAEHAA
jgi:hypothetical protein